MSKASEQILTVAQMAAAEQMLIEKGSSVDALMAVAGRGGAEWVWRLAGKRAVTVLCGPGNNGGDGYVIAETLRQRGVQVRVVAPFDPRTDAARNARAAYGGDVLPGDAPSGGDVLVDALFGSGLVRPLGEDLSKLLWDLASRHSLRLAVDLPSGVESDTGRILDRELPDYAVTVALGAWKLAHWLMPAAAHMGARRLVPIGIETVAHSARLMRAPMLEPPPAEAHKYSRGFLAVVGGAMPGASLLACRAAMHGGAGYVKLFADAVVQGSPPELVVETDPLEEALEDPRIGALLVGPGLGRDAVAHSRLERVLARDFPTVLDADALMLLRPEMIAQRQSALIATPHDGEMAKLVSSFAIEEQEDKRERSMALAKATGMVIVAKGPDTLVAGPDGEVVFAPPAPSWLSVAGTGDVLAGLIASRLASGASPREAACQAVWLHGEAARGAGAAFTARELAARIPAAMALVS